MMQYLSARWGEPSNWPAEPEAILGLIEETLDRNLIAKQSDRKSIAFLFEYAQYLLPTGDLNSLARGQAARLVRFLRWAQNPHFKQVNIAFCLVADRLMEVNERLVQNAYVSTVEVPLPDRDAAAPLHPIDRRGRRILETDRFLARRTGRHVERAEPGRYQRRPFASDAQRTAASMPTASAS